MGPLFSKSCMTFPEVAHDRFSDDFLVHTMRQVAHNKSCTTKSSRVDGPLEVLCLNDHESFLVFVVFLAGKSKDVSS